MYQDILIVDDSPSNIQALRFAIQSHCCKNNGAYVRMNLSGVINPAGNLFITDVNLPEKAFIDADCLAYSKNITFDKANIQTDDNLIEKLKDKVTKK